MLISPSVEKPDIQVRLHWGRELLSTRASVNGYHLLGSQILMGDSEILQTDILTLPGLQLQTSLSGANISIDAAFHPRVKRIKLHRGRRGRLDKEQVFASLIYYLVYFPLLWHAECTRQWYPLHASAVTWPQGAMILAGLDGVGKSTLTLAFLSDSNARLLSENLILHDKSQVYALPEPIHLDVQSRELLTSLNGRLRPAGRAHSRDGHDYEVPISARVQSATPRLMCTLRQGGKIDLRLMSAAEALETLLSSDMLTRELCDYAQQVAALNLLSPRPGRLQQRIAALQRLLKQLACYELTIKPGEDLIAFIALVRERLGW